jgi:hypothetical protein
MPRKRESDGIGCHRVVRGEHIHTGIHVYTFILTHACTHIHTLIPRKREKLMGSGATELFVSRVLSVSLRLRHATLCVLALLVARVAAVGTLRLQ